MLKRAERCPTFAQLLPQKCHFRSLYCCSAAVKKGVKFDKKINHPGRRQNILPWLLLVKGDSRLCASCKRKELLCDGQSIALRISAGMTPQDTPLTQKHLDVLVSISSAGTKESQSQNQQNPRLPDQSYRQDISMRTKRPIFHSSVESVALFLFVGTGPGVVPLRSKFAAT